MVRHASCRRAMALCAHTCTSRLSVMSRCGPDVMLPSPSHSRASASRGLPHAEVCSIGEKEKSRPEKRRHEKRKAVLESLDRPHQRQHAIEARQRRRQVLGETGRRPQRQRPHVHRVPAARRALHQQVQHVLQR